MTLDRFDVLAIGRSCIDLYAHQIGVPITEVTSFDAYVGGCPTNISVGTRRLGLRSALLTAVGDDQVGDFVLAFLRRTQIETAFIPRKPKRCTSAVILTIEAPDRCPLTYYRENCADRELTCDDVRRAPVEDSGVIVLVGTSLTHEPARSATLFAASRAAAAGKQVFVDIDYRPDLWNSRADFANAVQALVAQASIAVATEEEVKAATDTDDLTDGIDQLLGSGPNVVIVKRGAAGAVICTPGATPRAIPPFSVDVLDVLGAGDAFASGLIWGLRRGEPLDRAVRMGNAAGAIIVTRHGCANFMPTEAEVAQFVAQHGGW